MIDLSVIIVSYNTRELLERCLTSVAEEIGRNKITAEVIVVDNDSKDDSVELLKQLKNHKSYFINHILFNRENLGFGKANNQGVREAKGRYILFLNPDTELKSGALAKMVDFLDKNPKVGIASCKLLNSDGTMQPQGGYLPRLSTVAAWALFLDDFPILREILPSYQMGKAHRSFLPGDSWRRQESPDYKEIGWVGGTAMFVRKDAWEQLGGFDENIFMYGEDVEICYRANRKGWKTAINPQAEIVHAGKASGGKWVTGEVEGLLYIFRKHKPAWEMPILRAILGAGMGARWLIFGILGGNSDLRLAYVEAIKAIIKNGPPHRA